MGKTLVRASHRKYKKNAKDGKRTKRGRHVMKKSRRMHSYSRSHKRYTRTRRHMRNKKGGEPRFRQPENVLEFKKRIGNESSLSDCVKNFSGKELTDNVKQCIDAGIHNLKPFYSEDDEGYHDGLAWWVDHCEESQLLQDIDTRTQIKTELYKYILLKVLLKNRDSQQNDKHRMDNQRYHPNRNRVIGTLMALFRLTDDDDVEDVTLEDPSTPDEREGVLPPRIRPTQQATGKQMGGKSRRRHRRGRTLHKRRKSSKVRKTRCRRK